MTIRFVKEAELEFLEAISYYEDAQEGLGRRFKDEVDRCVLLVAERPETCRERVGGHRRINLRVFPYYLAYVLRRDVLWVLAVAHASRRPGYWFLRRRDAS